MIVLIQNIGVQYVIIKMPISSTFWKTPGTLSSKLLAQVAQAVSDEICE